MRLGQPGALPPGPTATLIPCRARSVPAPLSYAQRRLWLAHARRRESHAYNEVSALDLRGRLDATALERSVHEIAQRHEALRTTFPVVNGEPVQQVNPVPRAPMLLVDLGAFDEQGRHAELTRLIESATCHSFDLGEGPLVQLSLVRLQPDHHVLVIAAHHIVLDGWSTRIFLRELAACYDAFRSGRPLTLAPLPIQYADFADWERGYLTEERMAGDLEYWIERLHEPPAMLTFPLEKPHRPGGPGGARRFFDFGAPLAGHVRDLAKREGATPFMVLLAAFQALICRYTGQTDLLIGSPIANRRLPELEPIIGFFVNTIVFRADLRGEPAFRTLLRATRETAIAAFDHQDAPFERVVEALHARGSRQSPLPQVVFSYQSTPVRALAVAGLSITSRQVESIEPKCDLLLSIGNGAHGLGGYWEYDTSLFDHSAIDRMTDHLATLLGAAIAEPARSIAELPLMPATERRRVIDEWNQTDAPVPTVCIHDLIEERAARLPDAPAVTAGAVTVTYGELDRRASVLASRLRAAGAGPDRLVGLCAPPSVDMIVGLLAILKAGSAYVPLDPAYPRERLAQVIDDAAMEIVLVHGSSEDQLPETRALRIRLDGGPGVGTGGAALPDIAASPQTAVLAAGAAVTPSNLAYVIYTSGSSGRPKGVMVTHRNLVSSTLARVGFYRGEHVERFLLLSSLSFDSSVAGIFWTLTTGGHLIVPPESERFDLRAICRIIQDHRVTHLLCVPSLYDALLREAQPYNLEGLQTVIVAGEACRPGLVQRHHWLGRGIRLVNEYGPTEATVWCCVYDCEPGQAHVIVPVGRPIANARVFILDERRQPVPIGLPGELFIGGAGVTRGYWRDPMLTAARFIPDPFGGAGTLYLTGDRARYRPDGTIDLIGRIDDQVKIRGCRLELDEVAAALASHAAVREAATGIHGDSQHNVRLAGYVVVNDGASVSDAELRAHVAARLPDFAVPADLVRVDRLPRLPNGKLERQALAALTAASIAPSATPERMWTALERQVADVWREVLGKAAASPDDNFFQIGGDSLSVIRVHNRLRSLSDRDIAITDLFKAPTVASMAALLDVPVPTGEL